jgi:hypothetical protein
MEDKTAASIATTIIHLISDVLRACIPGCIPVLVGEKITVIHRSTGLVYSTFTIYQFFDQMQLYLDKYLVTFNQDECVLRTFSLNGEFLSEIALDKKLGVTIFYPLDKELCFATDQDKFCIF